MKKVLVCLMTLLAAGYMNVWGTVDSGDEYTWDGTTKTLTIHKSGDFADGIIDDYTTSTAPWKDTYSSAVAIIVSDGITQIGTYAFYNLSKVTTVTLPASLSTIKTNAFRNCSAVANIKFKGTPAQWASINFSGGTRESYSHPLGVRTSGTYSYCFYGSSTSATNLVIEPTIKTISSMAFYRGSFTSVSIPGTINSIGDYAFYYCASIATILVNRKNAPSLGTDVFTGIAATVNYYVPSSNTGYTGSPWSGFTKNTCVTHANLAEGIPWTLDSCGVLTLDATNIATKSITFDKDGAYYPMGLFRRVVYKIVLKGEIENIDHLGRYLWGLSEILLDQTAVPTSGTDIGYNSSTKKAYDGLFNKRDKLTLSIKSASEGHANLSTAPWNDATHWNIVVRTCPDWGLHYGTDGVADWDEACFSQVGSTNEWQIEDFVIPDKPNWYVDNAAGNDAKKTLSNWGDLYFAASQGDGDRPMVGDAIGAIGTVRIYDNSTWNNRYAGFIPNGYVLKFGSDEYSFALESSNVFHSEIIEYNSTSANYNVSVGIENADREYVSTDHTQEMRHIFLKDDCNWSGDYAKLAIYYWNGGDNGWCGFLQLVPGETGLYEGWIPSGYTNLKFVRFNSSKTSVGNWDGEWNETGDLSIGSSDNMFTMSAFSSGSWSTYERKGKFVIHTDYTDKNWYVRFQPHYVLHFDANGGEGAPEDQSVAINAAPCQLTVSSTEPTRTGYDFLGWSTNSDATSPDDAWDPGDTHAMTGDVTLYAVWSPATLTFNASEDANWNNANNWSPSSLPTINHEVIINKPATVNTTSAVAKSILINQNGGNTGQLEIAPGQKLIVAGTIKKTTDGETYSATEANDIIINSDATNGLGALVMGTHDGTNQATVNFTTLSNGTSEDNTSIAQYVGTPFNDENNILYNWYNSWVYGIDHTGGIIGWERVNEGQGMAPFKGYCVFSADGVHHNYWQQGTLVASENQTLSGLNWQSGEGTANLNNENLLANSWMAPIKISAMEASDFTNTEATIYIFNSTSASDYEKGGFASNYTGYTPGTAGEAIIPSMQSFSVFTNAAGGSSVALDYNKIVYQAAIDGAVPGPNRAPLREAAEEANKIRLFVHAESGYGDLLYMWERSDFSEAFENGWDGHKLFGESVAPQLFALSPDGDLAINCIPTFEGVQMGFKAGEQDNSYTLTFEYSDEAQPLYLLDVKENTYTQITNSASYSFTTTDTDVHNRFVLTYNAPSAPTAIETTPAATTGKKVMYDNHLFILHNGRIFNAQGAMIQ